MSRVLVDRQYGGADMADAWVELRVHGVSGASPESMLDGARVRQVAGDEFGRLFRRVDDRGAEIPGRDGQAVEGYHWGRFTSGTWSQALWLLLMPFGLVNAAQFTLDPPTTTSGKAGHAVAGAMLRLVGLALTGLIVLGAAVITMDLWAWQRIGPRDGFPYALVPLAALVAPALVLLTCNFLGRARLVGGAQPPTDKTVEQARRARRRAPGAVGAGMPGDFWDRDLPSDLVRPAFFGGDPDAPALRLLHIAAGLLLLAVLGFAPDLAAPVAVPPWGFAATLGLLVVVVLIVVLLGDPEESASIDVGPEPLRRLKDAFHERAVLVGQVLAMLAVVAFGLAAVRVVLQTPAPAASAHRPGIDEAVYAALFVALGGLAVLVLANVIVLRSERRSPARANARFAPYAGGFACTLLTALGLFVGIGFTAAFAAAAARVLSTGGAEVRVPELFSRVVYAWGITTVLIAVVGLVGVLAWYTHRNALRALATRDFTRPDGLRVPERWIGHIAFAMWTARLKNHLIGPLAFLTGAGAVLSVFTVAELWPQAWGREPQRLPSVLDLVSQSETHGGDGTVLVLWIGTLTLTGLASALVVLGRGALLGESTRRAVNVVWDVFSFWPRAVHPFVPPAYSQRAVPDLQSRIRRHLAEIPPGPPTVRDIVLCGHSQGSLLAFAALLRFTGSERELLDRIGLLTFGSQLQVMFSRAFPAYVNERAIGALFGHLDGAWRNLYRETDRLGGPVLSWRHAPVENADWFGRDCAPHVVDRPEEDGSRREFGPDWRLLDPPLPDLEQQRRPVDALRVHGDYWSDLAWGDALMQLRYPPQAPPVPEAPATAAPSAPPAPVPPAPEEPGAEREAAPGRL
jgi:hypothetical protein